MSSITFTTQHLFIIVTAFIAGICYTPYFLWSLVAFGTSVCLSIYEKQIENILLLIIFTFCFFFFGATRYYQNRELYFSDNNFLNKKCNITAIVQEIQPRLDEEEQVTIVLQLEQIESTEKKLKTNKKIYLFLPYYTNVWLKPCQKINIKNITLSHPISESYQEYLIRENIWAIAHQKQLGYTTIEKPNLFAQHMNLISSYPLSTTKHSFSELTKTLYLSIFCGKKIKSSTTSQIKRLFQYWGISHHLARSGLHLIILVSLLSLLLSFFPFSSSKKQIIILVLLFIYYLITYVSVAFMRAFCMYFFYILCKQLYLPSNSIHILLITTLLILITNPHHLFFLDFQLSFSITLLILWFLQTTQNIKTVASS